MMKIINETKFTINMNKGNPNVGINPIKFDKMDSPNNTGRADSANDIKKLEELA
jgi:hypothetical protein